MQLPWTKTLLFLAAGLAILSATGVSQFTNTQTFWGRASHTAQSFGESVRGTGDINGDGFDDIVVGSRTDNMNGLYSGSARVFSGVDGSVLFHAVGSGPFAYFGDSVNGAGDVNNDGFDDIIVGAPGFPFANGQATVYSGLNGTILYTIVGGSVGFTVGSEVGHLGDINNDGFDDFVVGALSSGEIRVYSGLNGSVIHTFFGMHPNDKFGRSLANAGDVDGDGVNDLLVGIPHYNAFKGAAQVFSGANGAIIHTFIGANNNDEFGMSVSGAGDLNNDGFADVLVGVPGDDGAGTRSGRVLAFSGIDGSTILQIDGDPFGHSFGAEITGGGDVDGDGFEDILIGKPADQSTGFPVGSATLISGKNGQIIDRFFGSTNNGDFGSSLSMVGDTNGDGFADFVIGAFGEFPKNYHTALGSARLYLGRLVPVTSYDSQVGETSISLGWTNTQGDPNALTGSIHSHSSSPFGRAAYGISLAPADILTSFDFPSLIAIDATNLIAWRPFNYDFGGRFSQTNLSRQHLSLAGANLYLQVFQYAPVFASSNGLNVLIAP